MRISIRILQGCKGIPLDSYVDVFTRSKGSKGVSRISMRIVWRFLETDLGDFFRTSWKNLKDSMRISIRIIQGFTGIPHDSYKGFCRDSKWFCWFSRRTTLGILKGFYSVCYKDSMGIHRDSKGFLSGFYMDIYMISLGGQWESTGFLNGFYGGFVYGLYVDFRKDSVWIQWKSIQSLWRCPL